MRSEIHKNASGDRFTVVKTPASHWRATQLDGADRNYANIPATLTAGSRRDLLKKLSHHLSN